jgi:hypothetical protein
MKRILLIFPGDNSNFNPLRDSTLSILFSTDYPLNPGIHGMPLEVFSI